MKYCFLPMLLLLTHIALSQTKPNLNFESIQKIENQPEGWSHSNDAVASPDSLIHTEGRYAYRVETTGKQHFIVARHEIPATYAGKQIELKGYLKTENISTDGFAGFYMRIDGPGGMLALENMEGAKITGTNDWKEYNITLPLSEEATTITVGTLIVGKTGKVWIDDLRLFFDNIPLKTAPPKIIKVYPAAKDSAEFAKGSNITLPPINAKLNENLRLLGHVWGFLKYYHPRIAQGELNWDFELFRFLPGYLKATSTKARDAKLLAWINSLGKIPACTTCKDVPKKAPRATPQLTWIQTDIKDKALRAALEYVRDNRTQNKNYYIDQVPGVGNPVFKNEAPYKKFVLPDDGFRLLALYRYWNMVEYFFPYKTVIGEDWTNVLNEFIPRMAVARTPLQYWLTTRELITRINDSHAALWGMDSIVRNYKGNYRSPAQVKFIENKLVVTDYYDKTRGLATGLLPGDIITHINNEEVEKIVARNNSQYPASNQATRLRNIARDILRGPATQITLNIERDNVKSTRTIRQTNIDSLKTAIDWDYNKPDSCYSFIQNDIGYIYLGNINSKLLPRIFETFADTKGIVIDIRTYPSEFVVFSLGAYLMPQPTEFVKFSVGNISYPGQFTDTEPLKVGRENNTPYKGKVVILINELSQSQSEYTTMAFRVAPNATVIGSQTAGADGNVSSIILPGNLSTMITGLGVYYPNGEETQRIGIKPDIEVKPTIKAIKDHRDEALERAIQHIKN